MVMKTDLTDSPNSVIEEMVINSMSNEKRVKLRKPERQKYMILINLRKEEKGEGV